MGPAASAIAAPPNVTIASPLNGSVTNDRTPSFSGLAEEAGGEVTLRIYSGPTAEGTVIQELSTLLSLGGRWSLGPTEPLGDGTYTAQATQTNFASETGTSLPVTFTIDTAAPTVTLNSPQSPSDDTTRYAPRRDRQRRNSDHRPDPRRAHGERACRFDGRGTGTGAGWTSGDASPALSVGQYTAIAIQASSLVGNPAGRSGSVTFTVTPPPVITPALVAPPAPPVASFKWIPSAPHTGEPVTLVSTSTDASSPITGFAWALRGNGLFTQGESALATSFSTPGAHVVQLRVTAASGLSSARRDQGRARRKTAARGPRRRARAGRLCVGREMPRG